MPLVLAIDDSKADNDLLKAAFSDVKPSCEVRAFTTANDAQAYLAEDPARNPPPALILLDIQMPGKDGFDFLQWLRRQEADWRRTPVIMLSTSQNRTDVKKAYESGANSYLVKPSGYGELVEMVQALLAYWIPYNQIVLKSDS